MIKDTRVELRWHHKRYTVKGNDNIWSGIKMKLHKIKWKAIVKLIIIKAWGGITWDKMKGGIKIIKVSIKPDKKKGEGNDIAWSKI